MEQSRDTIYQYLSFAHRFWSVLGTFHLLFEILQTCAVICIDFVPPSPLFRKTPLPFTKRLKTAKNVRIGAKTLCGTDAVIKAGDMIRCSSKKCAMICAKGNGNFVSVIFFLS